MSTIFTLILLFVGFIAVKWILSWLVQLRKLCFAFSVVPGFRSNPILGDVQFLIGRSFDGFPLHSVMFQWLLGLSSLYRKEGLCKIWIMHEPHILLYSADAVEPILSSSTLIDKSIDYKLLQCWLGTGLLTSTGDKWRRRRKLITPTFHYSILDDFLPIFDRHSKTFVKKLETFSETDIVLPVTLFTLDTICETAMGVRLNAQEEMSSPYVDAVASFTEAFTRRSIQPWLESDTVFFLTADGRKLKKALRVLHGFTSQVVKQRKEELLNRTGESVMSEEQRAGEECGRKVKRAFLDMLLQAQMVDSSMSDKDICEEVDTFMFEGHDTTAMGICWTLYHLGRHPQVQEKAYEELQQLFGDDKNSPVTSQHLKEMKYLECVIKECQRLSPSVPAVTRTVSEDVRIKGYNIPAGTNAIIYFYGLHRDPTVFPNPELFDPDRFLPENCLGRHPFAFTPFSAGPRNCIGQKFAMNEMKTCLCNVIRNFSMEALEPIDKIVTTATLILRSVNGIKMKFRKRA